MSVHEFQTGEATNPSQSPQDDARNKLLDPSGQNGTDGVISNQDAAYTSNNIDLAFNNVCITMGIRSVLNNVSGKALGSEMLAIMGPSGAGKTTLLNSLSGRLPITSGEITLNNMPMNKTWKRKISYVLQEDIFFPNISLRETLNFIAMIRLPEHISKQDKLARVDEVIDALDLRKCENTIIGNALQRGLSGGEKKRASIAGEIITDPKIIFLDEPTSGLDYTSALSLISTVKKIAVQMNKTVVLTIHQPSSHIFFKFDKLLLLCNGQVGYYGPSDKVIPFFADLGMHLEPYANPADFVVDQLQGSREDTQRILEAGSKLSIEESPPDEHKAPSKMNGVQQTDTGSVHISFDNLTDDDDLFEDDSKWPTGFVLQYIQLTIRTFHQSKSRIFDKTKVFENVIMCFLVSLLWFQLPRTEETLNDRLGVLYFLASHTTFGPLFEAAHSFPTERLVIFKERASGWYRLSAYYLAKNTVELPLIVLMPAILITICYWCIGLNGFAGYIVSLIIIVFNTMAGQSIGLFLGIAFMDFRRATVMCTLTILFMLLLGGFYVKNIPEWLAWTKYFSFTFYSFHSLVLTEFTASDPLRCMSGDSSHIFQECISPNVTSVSPDRVLEYLDVTWPFAGYFMPLVLFILAFRTIGYLILRFIHTPLSV